MSESKSSNNPLINNCTEERSATTKLLAQSETLKRFLNTSEPCARLILKSALSAMNSSLDNLRDCYYPRYPGNYQQFRSMCSESTITMFEDLLKTHAEIDLPSIVGHELTDFIYFTLFHGRIKLELVEDIKNKFSIWKFDDVADENNHNPYFTPLFHGSSLLNLYSIFCNDLRSMSNTSLMSTGAARGAGIYCTNTEQVHTAMRYMNKQGGNGILLVMESFMKNPVSGINVIQEKEFAIRYVIVEAENYSLSSSSPQVISKIERIICEVVSRRIGRDCIVASVNGTICEKIEEKEEGKNSKYTYKVDTPKKHNNENKKTLTSSTNSANTNKLSTKTNNRLMMELKQFLDESKRPAEVLLFEIVNNQMNHWKILLKIDESTDLGKDLIYYKIPGILLHILFCDRYPFQPPFVYVEKPIFKRLTGHVVDGGVCASILSTSDTKTNDSGWSPLYSMEKLMPILSLLLAVEGEGRIDPSRLQYSYSYEEAKRGFSRALNLHQW